MIVFMVTLALAASSSAQFFKSAASDAQIRFAKENKYDGTGPGAKTREYAYKTYKTLDDALLAFVNDPDTIIPEYEKRRVLQKFVKPVPNEIPEMHLLPRYQPKTVDEYTGYKPPKINSHVFYPLQHASQEQIEGNGFIWNERPKETVPIKLHRVNYLKESPLSISHFKKTENWTSRPVKQESFDHNPQYTFSYGVHDRGTGDSKSAHETRDGGTVHGFYTFMDSDGKQRTVRYTADDKHGFRADVQRTYTNTQ